MEAYLPGHDMHFLLIHNHKLAMEAYLRVVRRGEVAGRNVQCPPRVRIVYHLCNSWLSSSLFPLVRVLDVRTAQMVVGGEGVMIVDVHHHLLLKIENHEICTAEFAPLGVQSLFDRVRLVLTSANADGYVRI